MSTSKANYHATAELKILIAEDHTLIRKMTKQIIKSSHPSVTYTETDNTNDLIMAAKTGQFDLLVLDIFLTDGNTMSLLPAIRVMQPDAAILFHSMCSESLYAKRLILNGANGFLNKCR